MSLLQHPKPTDAELVNTPLTDNIDVLREWFEMEARWIYDTLPEDAHDENWRVLCREYARKLCEVSR